MNKDTFIIIITVPITIIIITITTIITIIIINIVIITHLTEAPQQRAWAPMTSALL